MPRRAYSSRPRICAPADRGRRSFAHEIAKATSFILLVGEASIGKWQVPEYDKALDKWVKSERTFPLVVVLLDGLTAPGLPFLRRLHWIITSDPASEKDVARLFDAASGTGTSPGELWRYTIALSRPSVHGGEGQRLFLRPQARNRRRALRACRRTGPAPRAHRQFGCRQILARTSRGAGGAQAPGMARGRGRARRPGSFYLAPAGTGAFCRCGPAPIR